MAAGLRDLFESIMSLGITVGARASEKGAKGAFLSAAKKIGWASSDASVGGGIYNRSLHSHKLSGHSMANGFAGREDVANYDPKNSYKQRMNSDYDRGRMSGSGAINGSFKRMKGKESAPPSLSRSTGGMVSREVCRYQSGAGAPSSTSNSETSSPQFASISSFGVGNKAPQKSSLKTGLKY